MGTMESSSFTTIAPLLLRNLVTSVFFYADKSLLNLSEKYKLLELIRCLIISSFLFLLRLLPSFFPSLEDLIATNNKPPKDDTSRALLPYGCGGGDSGIARALSQLLSIVNDIPVSSRKYEVVRSLAETLIDENNKEDVQALREVNRSVLSAAFSRTLSHLEAAVLEQNGGGGEGSGLGSRAVQYRNRILKAVRSVGEGAWARGRSRDGLKQSECSAEKLAAELLWLAQKLVACGCGEEAVWKWASASNLAWLALSAEPRLQVSLLKVSAFLFKQARGVGLEYMEDEEEEGKKQQQRQTKMKMLMCWLPLLCRASNGTDAPVLSTSGRAELERVLEEMIEMLEEEQKEQVLSLWLYHFTYTPSSDWPNLRASYARWCTASRKLLILQ